MDIVILFCSRNRLITQIDKTHVNHFFFYSTKTTITLYIHHGRL